MKARLRRLRDVSLVVIDYLQLMTNAGAGRRSENRVQEVSEMTRSLKVMAKEFNLPVLVLSQLSRGPESRADRRPMLSDLRESGSIEQDADLVLFLYRDSYYNPDTEQPGLAECIIAKNRHGETGTVKLGWDGQYTRFRNVELARNEG
jgi:replicative DNA helicase